MRLQHLLVLCGIALSLGQDDMESLDQGDIESLVQEDRESRGQDDRERVRRIVGGVPMDVEERRTWRALVSLRFLGDHSYVQQQQGMKHMCGGTLIATGWVLTAASCVSVLQGLHFLANVSKWRAVLGEYNRGETDLSEQIFGIESIHVHPNYKFFPYLSNDIALLKLDGVAKVTNWVAPRLRNRLFDVPDDIVCKVAGWGQTRKGDERSGSRKRKIVDPAYGRGTLLPHVISIQRVDMLYCRHRYHDNFLYQRLDDTFLCFQYSSQGVKTSACRGDFGGPMFCKVDQRPNNTDVIYLTGIVSQNTLCGDDRAYGLYTNVQKYDTWIQKTMRNS